MTRREMALDAIRGVPGAAMAGLSWVWGQIVDAGRNTVALFDYLTFDRILPPSLVDTIQFYIEAVPAALGLRGVSRERMVSAIVTLGILAVLSTVLTLGLTVAVLVALTFLLVLGLLRLFPAVNRAWKRSTGGLVRDDYDLPRWKRD